MAGVGGGKMGMGGRGNEDEGGRRTNAAFRGGPGGFGGKVSLPGNMPGLGVPGGPMGNGAWPT